MISAASSAAGEPDQHTMGVEGATARRRWIRSGPHSRGMEGSVMITSGRARTASSTEWYPSVEASVTASHPVRDRACSRTATSGGVPDNSMVTAIRHQVSAGRGAELEPRWCLEASGIAANGIPGGAPPDGGRLLDDAAADGDGHGLRAVVRPE